ncbi:MAG TPA: hypothetical protein VL947_08525, partial [Cytophagales bacterium]|nr:hypothetical protein [Cytophagales bacterium]
HTQITRVGSSLNILIDKRNKLKAEDGNLLAVQIEALINISNEFDQLIQTLKKIEVLPFELFSNRLPEPFTYPDVIKKDKAWNEAPHSKVLPERFVVVTVQNDQYVHVAVGDKIPAKLQIGINPANPDDNAFHLDANGDLQIDEKLLWMTEYKEALKAGMAISIPLTDTQALKGFDQVFVLGIRKEDPLVDAKNLNELLQNHIYAPDGMSFLKIGTPTNNTQKDKAGYNPEKDFDAIFDIEISQKVHTPRKYQGRTDGERLQHALGLSGGIVNKAVEASNTSVSDALVMNRALWNATMGHYMEEMWDGLFTYDNIGRTEKFFVENVSGRGFIPSLRIAEQPYGIVNTTAFSQLELYPGLAFPQLSVTEMKTTPAAALETRLQQRFDLRLQRILLELQKEWQGFRVMHAGILNEGSEADSYQKNYMNVLGLHATSLTHNVRYAVNVGKGPEIDPSNTESVATNFNAADEFGPHGLFAIFKEVLEQGIYTKSFEYISEENPLLQLPFQITDLKYNEILNNLQGSRIFVARFLQTQPEIKGPTVDRLPVSEALLSNKYIDWLLHNTPDTILASNKWSNLPDKTLLFMLLRQSLMQAYQEAALSIMQAEGLISERNRRDLGNSKNYLSFDTEKNKRVFSTKWHYLLKDLPELKGLKRLDLGNAFYSYLLANSPGRPALSQYVYSNKASMLDNPLFINYPNKANHQKQLTKVDEVRDALQSLSGINTKDLEILLAEHLDLCTYRLDAWQLGFVNRRLKQHRTASPEGIHLGAFGWVENLRPDLNRSIKPTTEIPAKLLPELQSPVYEDPDNQGFIHGPSVQHGIAAAILRAGYIADRKNNGAGSRLAVNLSSERVRQALTIIEGIKNGMEMGAILGFQFERGLHERYQMGVELDKYIQPLRKKYPLIDEMEDTADGAAPTYQSHVINGQKMLQEAFIKVNWNQNNTEKTLADLLIENNYALCPESITTLTSNPAERNALIQELDRIADTVDAVGDLVMSEGVYQIVKGNHVRAAATLASMSPNPKTASVMPNPEIIETPRSGLIVTQRTVWSLPVISAPIVIPGWATATA